MQTAGLAGGAASPGAATLQSAALIFRKATPHTSILFRHKGPLQAGLHHGATLAYRFRLIDLHQSGTVITDREAQFEVLVDAVGLTTPIQSVYSSSRMSASYEFKLMLRCLIGI